MKKLKIILITDGAAPEVIQAWNVFLSVIMTGFDVLCFEQLWLGKLLVYKSMTKMDLQAKLNPTITALLVIDIQNDFCSPSGLMASMGKDVSSMDSMIKKIQKLADICSVAGVPVCYTQQIYDRSKLTDLQKEQYDLDGKMITCDIRGDGYKFYKLSPPADRIFPKYTYNAFSNPDLSSELLSEGVKTLIITGVSTQICVETAIRNGFDIGYKIVVPRDLVATTSNDPSTQQRTLRLVKKTYGVVVDSSEITAILKTTKRPIS